MLHGLEALAGSGDLRLELGDDQFHLEGEPGDAVTLADAEGMTVYADLDGDGIIDHISSVHADGGVDVFTTDPHRAAWGLAVPDPEVAPAVTPLSWGLADDTTPESGAGNPGTSLEKAGWHWIEHGEKGWL
ncbi:hypothetical protein [Corynebacterium sp.]|uniref:hypothetical protein n=1 Tax=Corynebacterium sp. TaxID=1720 RepID=UPI0026DF74AB|nr:hypothetical protein [Corynebacterium sp.]MDO5511245.1 hypothetical protein [Corynebacterium sp.]